MQFAACSALFPVTKAFVLPPSSTCSLLKSPPVACSSVLAMSMSAVRKPFDVVVFGATSFVGKLTAEYYLSTYGAAPPNFKWAISGRQVLIGLRL